MSCSETTDGNWEITSSGGSVVHKLVHNLEINLFISSLSKMSNIVAKLVITVALSVSH